MTPDFQKDLVDELDLLVHPAIKRWRRFGPHIMVKFGAMGKETQMAMGQTPLPPVNIPILTKIGSKMGGVHLPRNGTIGVDPQPYKGIVEKDNCCNSWNIKEGKAMHEETVATLREL